MNLERKTFNLIKDEFKKSLSSLITSEAFHVELHDIVDGVFESIVESKPVSNQQEDDLSKETVIDFQAHRFDTVVRGW